MAWKLNLLLIGILIFHSFSVLSQKLPPAKRFFEDSLVKERWNEDQEGLMHGEYLEYHENGKLHISGTYNHGVISGIWKYFLIEGGLAEIDEYLNGKLFTEVFLTYACEFPSNEQIKLLQLSKHISEYRSTFTSYKIPKNYRLSLETYQSDMQKFPVYQRWSADITD